MSLPPNLGPRNGILSLTIKDKSVLYAAYMPFIRNGGLFIPTNKNYKLGDEVFMLLNLMEEPEKIPVAGKVVWITPKGAQGNRAAGIGVQFNDGDNNRPQQDRNLPGRGAEVGPADPHDVTLDRIMLVDSHCHLDRLDLAAHGGSLDAALDAARARGVGQFLCIGVSADNAQAVKALAERYADVHCSVGVHPLDLEPGSAPALDWLLGELAHPRVVAIGETGLDYHYEPEAAELQQEAFRLHLEAARITAKPVIVHTREARADTLALLREAALPQAGVLHCFTEDWEMARSALDLGFYISLSGIVTFRNADALREVARQVPADRLLVETDSPYLAPIPHRGKPNLPEYVRDVAEFLATLRGVSLETLAEQTTANFHRLFPLAR